MIRLMSWNVRSLRDDRAALVRVVRAAAPDLLCVQEAPRHLRWRSRCAALARECGLVLAVGGRDAGAVLIATSLRVTVRESHAVLLRRHPELHQRGLAWAAVSVGGVELTVATTHLDLVAEERAAHAEELLAALRVAPSPVVLAGDINEGPGRPAWAALAAGVGPAVETGPTFPARAPRSRIDAVFVDPRLRVLAVDLPSGPEAAAATDHVPLVVDLAGA